MLNQYYAGKVHGKCLESNDSQCLFRPIQFVQSDEQVKIQVKIKHG